MNLSPRTPAGSLKHRDRFLSSVGGREGPGCWSMMGESGHSHRLLEPIRPFAHRETPPIFVQADSYSINSPVAKRGNLAGILGELEKQCLIPEKRAPLITKSTLSYLRRSSRVLSHLCCNVTQHCCRLSATA
ncbi:hypothetical protein DPEC_G00276150 [Dallia pectoralis]|uniref:Uncharacterized protein n=1 Tax=Dallia pectoralis TaxID=75939 RepID=A0ACC2FLE4_DALPE|nr:hypothetical protein DPEC_G00276150 [Dallia pectoralis]